MLDFLTHNWYLVVIALGSGLMLLWPSLTGSSAGVSTAVAVQLINREKATLLDVSEAEEFAAGHAKNSRNVPFGQIAADNKLLPKNKTLPVVVICPTGARAGRAVAELKKLGYEQAVVLSGGLAAWREASLPTDKSA